MLFTQLFLKRPGGMVNSVDPNQTAPIWVCTVCISCFVRNFGVQNFRTFTVYHNNYMSAYAARVLVRLSSLFHR